MTATFKPLDLISPHTEFVGKDGALAPYGHRWLNKLRNLFHAHDVIEASLTPAEVAANSIEEEAFAVTGIVSGAYVSVSPPAITSGAAPMCARASDTDEISITFANDTGGPVTPAAGVYVIHQVRP